MLVVRKYCAVLPLLLALYSCASNVPYAGGVAPHDVNNTAGPRTADIDGSRRGPVAGIGLEGQDLDAIADQMVRDMLQNPLLANATLPPSVLLDASDFSNQSSQQINKNMIVDRLRSLLVRSANGRMVFVDNALLAEVVRNKQLRAANITNGGATTQSQGTQATDYKLKATMTTLDARSSIAGDQRSTQIEFEMINMDRGTIVWSNIYKIDRHAMDDVVYR